MSKTVLSALAAALLCLPAFAQGVRVTLNDGTEIRGELQGYGAGKYRILLGGGVVREIEETRVKEITLTDPAPTADTEAEHRAQDARSSFDRGDYPATLQNVVRALRDLDVRRTELNSLAARAAEAMLDGHLKKRDADGLAEALRRTWPSLPVGAKSALLTRLGERFGDQLRTAPDDPFTMALADSLAELAEEGTLAASFRKMMADHFAAMARSDSAGKDPGRAARLFRGAIKLDPARKDALTPPLRDALMVHARRSLETGHPGRAADAAKEAYDLNQKDPEAKRLYEDADFARIKRDSRTAFPGEAAALLRGYAARATREAHLAWARQALEDLKTRATEAMPEVAAQIRTYYPVRAGRTLVYERADGDLKERITVNSVERSGATLRVYHTLEEVYRDYATSKTYLVEIEKDAVVLASGSERETLLKFPLKEGESWSWRSGGREFRRTIRSLGETAAVGRGTARRTFRNCLVVDFTSTSMRNGKRVSILSTSTYAPNVGLVRLTFREDEFKKYNLELVEGAE